MISTQELHEGATGDICTAKPYRCTVFHSDTSRECVQLIALHALLNSALYFCGGWYIFQDVNGENSTDPQKLYWLDFSSSLPTEGLVSEDVLHSIDIPTAIPYAGGTGFFHDDTLLYFYGGITATSYSTDQLWVFDTSTQDFSQVTVQGGDFQNHNGAGAMDTTIRSQQLSFSTGGYDSSVTGMIKFDSSDPDNLSWSNITNAEPRLVEGAMTYLPVGDAGVLLTIGKYLTSHFNPDHAGWGWSYNHLWNISVFDIATSSW